MHIEQEIQQLIAFLSHPAGFEVSITFYGDVKLLIEPIDTQSPPQEWIVIWEEIEDQLTFEYRKEFDNLSSAAQFFVEKRHYKCLGNDFEKIKNETESS